MSECNRLQDCRFFNETIKDMPAVAEMMKKRFCFGAHETCARIVTSQAIGKAGVPADLAPNDSKRAEELIRNHRG